MSIEKTTDARIPLATPLHNRWSPRAYDPVADIPAEDLMQILDAARWTPSAANIQPWRYVVGHRGDQEFNTLMGSLSRGNASWAGNAAVLLLAIAVQESQDGDMYRWAEYDLGQSVAHLTFQALQNGYVVHQLGGFDVEALRRDFALEDRFEPFTIIAIGRQGTIEHLPERYRASESQRRTRLPLTDIVLCGLKSADTPSTGEREQA